ncbi:MAG: hypothetical protein AAGJ18_20000 [Bacteroidota bacterium]
MKKLECLFAICCFLAVTFEPFTSPSEEDTDILVSEMKIVKIDGEYDFELAYDKGNYTDCDIEQIYSDFLKKRCEASKEANVRRTK